MTTPPGPMGDRMKMSDACRIGYSNAMAPDRLLGAVTSIRDATDTNKIVFVHKRFSGVDRVLGWRWCSFSSSFSATASRCAHEA